MLTIRLSRIGKKKAPQYRIVLQENHRDPWSPAIEILGHYNPRLEKDNVKLKDERIEYWIGQGAQPSSTVYNLLIDAKIIETDKKNTVTITKKRALKLEEKVVKAKEKAEEKKVKAEEAKKIEKERKEEEAKAKAKEMEEIEDKKETKIEEVKTEEITKEKVTKEAVVKERVPETEIKDSQTETEA